MSELLHVSSSPHVRSKVDTSSIMLTVIIALLPATLFGIYNFGAGELLEIKSKSTGRLEMIPFSKAYVPEIDLEQGFIIVETVSLKFVPEDGVENES